MTTVYEIPTKKLFLTAVCIKVISSVSTLWLEGADLWFWILGLLIPLLAMGLYVFIGINRVDTSLSDEKFADSCYYMGFLFTITAIAIGMIDIGITSSVSLDTLAWRFGVAMVSTVVGMGVRVYLVNFKLDASDSIQMAEDAIVQGANKFVGRLEVATDRYHIFETNVNASTEMVVDHLNQRMDKLTEDHTSRLDENFRNLTQQTAIQLQSVLSEIQVAVVTVQDLAKISRDSIKDFMDGLQNELVIFRANLNEKLQNEMLPKEFFIDRLNPAVQAVSDELNRHEQLLKSSSSAIINTTNGITLALEALNKRSKAAAKALEILEKNSDDSSNLILEVKNLVLKVNSSTESINELMSTAIKNPDVAAINSALTKMEVDLTDKVIPSLASIAQLASTFPLPNIFVTQVQSLIQQMKADHVELIDLLKGNLKTPESISKNLDESLTSQ